MSYQHTQVQVWASVDLDLETVAKAVADADDTDIQDFILAIDERVSDLAWTIALRDRLNEVIEREHALDTGGAT